MECSLKEMREEVVQQQLRPKVLRSWKVHIRVIVRTKTLNNAGVPDATKQLTIPLKSTQLLYVRQIVELKG